MVDTTKILFAKKETTYSTDAVPTGTANAIPTRNFQTLPLQTDRIERNLDNGTWGADRNFTSNQRQPLAFEVELSGSGTAGTAAPVMELLEMCGMAAPVLTAVTDAQQKFALPNSAASSGTFYHSVGDQGRKSVGNRGTFSLDFTAGSLPFAKFDMLGLLPATPFTTGALTSADLTRWREPIEFNAVNSVVTLDGFAARTKSVRLNANKDLKVRNLVGSRYINAAPHSMTGEIVIEAPALTAKDYLATLRGDLLVPLSVTHGTVAGNILQITAPRVQLLNIAESEEDQVLMWTIQIALTVNSGGDDFTFISR